MSISRYVNEGFQGVNYIMWTDKESSDNSNPVDLDLDQETITNTCQVEDSSMNPGDPCDVSPVVNTGNQTDINHDVKSTSNDSLINITVGSNGSNLSHQRNIRTILQNENTEDASIPRKQYRSKSVVLTKSHALCCKLSIVFAICCTTGLSLMPIIFFYVSQTVNDDVPTGPEYSHERNTSAAKVC